MSLIGHNPNEASYYGNRAAAKMMLNRYQSALEDARHSIVLDDTFVKGHLRTAKCHMMLGNPALSLDYYDKVLALQPHNTQATEEVSVFEWVWSIITSYRKDSHYISSNNWKKHRLNSIKINLERLVAMVTVFMTTYSCSVYITWINVLVNLHIVLNLEP